MVAKKGKNKSSVSSKDTLKTLDSNIYLGAGEFTLPNGDVYAGDYCAHRSGLIWREGHGVYQTHDGQTYEGLWHDDKLVEGKEIIITYPNGAKYCGALLKNKYDGPGTYILESNMNLSCDFVANKPSGTITLVDQEGILWRGIAKENSALLLPENIFYLNLTEDRGKGLSKEPLNSDFMYPSTSTLTNENKEEELSDREWEKIIFTKSKLTEDNLDFTDCKWWKNYEDFRQKYDEIKTKINNEVDLDNEDYLWIERFKKYKKQQQMKKDLKNSRWKMEEKRVLALNEKFRSKDFNESCPPVNVICPCDKKSDNTRKLWDEQEGLQSDQLITTSANIIIVGSDDNLIDKDLDKIVMEAEVIKSAPSCSYNDNSSSNSEDQTVQFNDQTVNFSDQIAPRSDTQAKPKVFGKVSKYLISTDESEDLELHFTSFRQEMLLEKYNEMKKQEELDVEKVSAAKSMSKSDYELKKKESKESKGKKSDTLLRSETSLEKKGSHMRSSMLKKAKRDERILECVREILTRRIEKVVDKRKGSIKSTEGVHTHNVAAHTESLTGIPRELLLKK